ncbi:hypothetical protein [Taklimakanibacter deserti]|uniref:hypothetical protein n=1 Tax=Taklimakanibacter deserti TaxID=2267839 RepID=UPI000E64A051
MSGSWQEVTFSGIGRLGKWEDQMGTASMAKGAAVATMSKAAMIRNQWTGKVARRAFMGLDCVLILISGK